MVVINNTAKNFTEIHSIVVILNLDNKRFKSY